LEFLLSFSSVISISYYPGLNNDNKTYSDLFVNKAAKLEGEIKELRKQRDIVKENHEPALKQ